MMVTEIIPSILTDNINVAREQILQVDGLTQWIQIDIMDGVFVDNMSINISDLKDLDIKANLEVHLMVSDPESYLDDCRAIGVKRVIFHLESVDNCLDMISRVHQKGFEVGIALSPETDLERIKEYLPQINVVLIMGVKPGFGGQTFIHPTLDRIRKLRAMDINKKIEVDGGVTRENIYELKEAGANYFVVGSALYRDGEVDVSLRDLISEIS